MPSRGKFILNPTGWESGPFAADLKISAFRSTEMSAPSKNCGSTPPYGHALTSYRSQGSTSEESLLVLGEVAVAALARRQFYVGNTRYRGAHAIYLSDKDKIVRRLAAPDPGRELATEFTNRHRIVMGERHVPRPMRSMSATMRAAWQAMNWNRHGRRAAHTEKPSL